MVWRKPDPGLIHLLEEALAGRECALRKMFGCPAWFAPNGQMFSGVFESSLFVRLGEDERKELQARYEGAAPFEPMKGRPMKEYVVLPEAELEEPGFLDEWLGRALRYAGSLPAKKK